MKADKRSQQRLDLRQWKELGEMEKHEQPNWHSLFTLLESRKKFLVVVTFAGGVLAAAVVCLMPNMYTANALILPPAKAQSLSSVVMGQFGGMAAAMGPSLGLKDPADMYISILKSRSISDDLLSQFQLQRVYSEKLKEDARRELAARVSLSSGKDSMISISVEDHDPKRAADLANAYIAELNKQDRRLAITESAQRRLFFEREVESEKNALINAENALRETQLKTGVVEVSSQAQAVIASIAQLRAEIAIHEVALQRIRTGATSQNPEVIGQETELASLRSQLSHLEAGGTLQRSGDPFIPVANMPKSGLEYIRALRDVKYHEVLFEVLSKQYEAARIDEAKEAPVIQVVDYAIPPEKKSGPHRTLIVIFGTILAGLASCFYACVREGVLGASEDPSAAQATA